VKADWRAAACAVAVVGALVAAGCGSDSGGSSSGAGKSKVVKLGAFAPQSGPNSVIFPIAQATAACFKKTNADGGINGYTFDYKIIDDQYDPSLTVNAARKLVQDDDVLAVVGALGTATNLAAQGYLQSQKVPSVGPGTGSPKVANDDTFMTWQNYAVDGAFQANYSLKTLKAQHLGILYQNDDLGGPFHTGAAYEAKQQGATLAAVPFGLDEQDFTPVVSKLKAAGADVAIVAGSPKNFPLIIKAAESINYRPKWMAANYYAVPSVLEQLPAAQTRNMSFSSWHPLPDDAAVAEMRTALKQYYPKAEPSVYTVEGWLSCTVFNEAFRRMTAGGKEPTRQGLVDTLNQLKDFSNAYVRNLTYVEGQHTVAVDEFPFHWTGSALKPSGPFEAAPQVPSSVTSSS
jgi:branched-chain amino acid transport system substrate-binding protein